MVFVKYFRNQLSMDLYSEIILDHYKNPANKGRLENPSSFAEEDNPLCGDRIRVELQFADGKVSKIAFDGEGCAISQAAVSMLSEKLIGMTANEIKAMDNQEIYDMLGVEISPGRVKCALLGLVTAKKAAILSQNKDD